MFIKKIINKLLKGEKSDSDAYIKYLRKKGVSIGNNCTIYAPTKTEIDIQNPYMIRIGNNVKITQGVVILTHDFSWSVTSNIDGIITGSVGFVDIGNNVFIGMNSIILKNVTIGDNVIIGAGSVVTKDCESNYVYAGSPAKKIMSIYEYHDKRKKQQVNDINNLIKRYYIRYSKYPSEEQLREFVFLFKERNIIDNITEKILIDSGHYNKCKNTFNNTKPIFQGIDELIKKVGDCENDKKNNKK